LQPFKLALVISLEILKYTVMKKIGLPLFIMLIATTLLLSGCYKSKVKVVGNNNVVEETRSSDPFNRVVNEGNFNVYVENDTIWEVTIRAESNLISYIKTEVRGTVLFVYTDDDLKNHAAMEIYIKTPDINEISLSGSGLIYADSLFTNELEINLSGSGDIRGQVEADKIETKISGSGWVSMGVITDNLLTSVSGSGNMEYWGEATTASFTISGSGSVRAYDLLVNDCWASISGSGDMQLNVANYLNVNISGSGSIFYIGDPTTEINISGSGQVIKQ